MTDENQDRPSGIEANRTFLVVIDDSEEMQVALHFASRRAMRTGGRVALLYVQQPAEFQHWMAVGDLMREEAREEAEGLMQKLSAEVKEWS
ncbi:MAG: universal stress protein, partial [Pseudomonadota bacterium]